MSENTPRRFWVALYGAAAGLFALMDWSARSLQSFRGEWGLAVGALVLAAVLILDRTVFAGSWRESIRALGLGAPRAAGMIAASAIGALLIATLPLAALASGTTLSLRADWPWLVPGLLAQAGVAEEVLFRGLVFGRIRHGRPFWRAVALSLPPFALAHAVLLLSMTLPLALASLALSIVITPALCRLYELGGRTIWAPALLHAVVQGALKVADLSGGDATLLPLLWIGACALLPYLAFLWRSSENAAAA
ncbi:type II CAAX prenyl endopeptidase Rce1 family protein [Terricaulis sp.]|uniref:CPBP family glutamic-type intramembrane protease n=1 Tax=Terricaulis sp. TaxID=2768686 RepID=UPI003784FBD7